MPIAAEPCSLMRKGARKYMNMLTTFFLIPIITGKYVLN